MIEATIDNKGLNLSLSILSSKLENTIPLLEQIGDYMVGSVRRNIDESGRPNAWRGNVFGTHPLKRTGDSYNQVRKQVLSDTSVEISSGGGNAVYHHTQHNTTVTLKMRAFFWTKFYETQVEAWKWMALSKKSSFFYPERRYMMFQIPEDTEAIIKMAQNYFAIKKN